MVDTDSRATFARNLAYYVAMSGKTQRELAEVAGVAYSTFNEWMNGKKYPRIDKIEILANYFGILKSDLIEEKTEEELDKKKDNDALANIIVRLRTDKEFFVAVNAMYNLDSEKISGLIAFLK